MSSAVVRIHGVYGFLGDQLKGLMEAAFSAPHGSYLVADFLSEDTFQLLKTKLRREHFFAVFLENMFDLVSARAVHDRSHRFICNAGALDPLGCAEALAAHLDRLGVPLRVAAVTGDNLSDRLESMGPLGQIDSGEPLPEALRSRLSTISAYIGAEQATRALTAGADIVVAGRMTDAGLSLAAAVHHQGWRYGEDYDLLAAGALAGHLLSCGGQCARPVCLAGSDPDSLGGLVYPWAQVSGSGRIVIGCPSGLRPEAVTTQLFYGVSGPEFIDPDVVLDLSAVRVEALSATEVEVLGVRGRPRPDGLRVLALGSGDRVSLKGSLMVPRADYRSYAGDGFRRLLGARFRAGGALIEDQSIRVEHLGDTADTTQLFFCADFDRKIYATLARGQLPSLLVSGINGAYGSMPTLERETFIWDCLVDRERIEPALRVVFPETTR